MLTAPQHALVYCELREVMTSEEARRWIGSPHGQLGNRCPNDCSFEEVMRVIDMLKSGAVA